MNKKSRRGYCKGETKEGKPCRAAATAGGLCFFHANPDKASELGRIGGQKNRRAVPSDFEGLLNIEPVFAIRNTLAHLFDEVYAGRLEVKVVRELIRLLSLYGRVAHEANAEARRRGWLEEARDKSKK